MRSSLLTSFRAQILLQPTASLATLILLGTLQGCGDGGKAQKELADAKTRNQTLQAQLDQTEADRDAAQQQSDQHDADLQQANADLAQAQGDLQQANADLAQAQGDLQQANANLAQAQADLQQANADLAQAQGDLQQANANLAQAQADLQQANLNFAQSQVNLQQANVDLAQARVDLQQAHAALAEAQIDIGQGDDDLQQAQADLAIAQAQVATQTNAVAAEKAKNQLLTQERDAALGNAAAANTEKLQLQDLLAQQALAHSAAISQANLEKQNLQDRLNLLEKNVSNGNTRIKGLLDELRVRDNATRTLKAEHADALARLQSKALALATQNQTFSEQIGELGQKLLSSQKNEALLQSEFELLKTLLQKHNQEELDAERETHRVEKEILEAELKELRIQKETLKKDKERLLSQNVALVEVPDGDYVKYRAAKWSENYYDSKFTTAAYESDFFERHKRSQSKHDHRDRAAKFAYKQLLRVFKYATRGALDRNKFCADTFQKLMVGTSTYSIDDRIKGFRGEGGDRKDVINALLEVCMNKKTYVGDYITTLKSLADLIVSEPKDPLISLDDVIQVLVNRHSTEKGRIWDESYVNLEKMPWLISTPRYMGPDRTHFHTTLHSQDFMANWGNTIASGESFVDITTLSVPEDAVEPYDPNHPKKTLKPVEPRYGFVTTLRESLETLHRKDKFIQVRILFGVNSKLVQAVNPASLMKTLTANIPQKETKLSISIGTYDASDFIPSWSKTKWMSWNHSKIVAIDGDQLLTGGHNLYSTYLDSKNPVHDVSVLVPGLGTIGHQFSNELWKYTCDQNNVSSWRPAFLTFGEICTYSHEGTKCNRNACPGVFDPTTHTLKKENLTPISADNSNNEPRSNNNPLNQSIDSLSPFVEKIAAVGRLANLSDPTSKKENVSDVAIIEMIKGAKKAIFVSQQAILPLRLNTEFNANIVNELTHALARGVDIYVLTSTNEPAYAFGIGDFSYQSQYERDAAFAYFFFRMESSRQDSQPERFANVFKHFHILPTGNQEHEVSNHAKVLIVDGTVSYIGSHNFYDDSHAELGTIHGLRATLQLLTEYFSPLWHASLRTGPNPGFKDSEIEPAYKVGDFIYVHRNRNHFLGAEVDPSQNWTLARISETFPGNDDLFRLNLDFLIGRRGHSEKLVSKAELRLAPGGDETHKDTVYRSSNPPEDLSATIFPGFGFTQLEDSN